MMQVAHRYLRDPLTSQQRQSASAAAWSCFEASAAAVETCADGDGVDHHVAYSRLLPLSGRVIDLSASQITRWQCPSLLLLHRRLTETTTSLARRYHRFVLPQRRGWLERHPRGIRQRRRRRRPRHCRGGGWTLASTSTSRILVRAPVQGRERRGRGEGRSA